MDIPEELRASAGRLHPIHCGKLTGPACMGALVPLQPLLGRNVAARSTAAQQDSHRKRESRVNDTPHPSTVPLMGLPCRRVHHGTHADAPGPSEPYPHPDAASQILTLRLLPVPPCFSQQKNLTLSFSPCWTWELEATSREPIAGPTAGGQLRLRERLQSWEGLNQTERKAHLRTGGVGRESRMLLRALLQPQPWATLCSLWTGSQRGWWGLHQASLAC